MLQPFLSTPGLCHVVFLSLIIVTTANRAAGTAIGGHSQALGLSNKATEKEFAGRMKGAEITRTAGAEAARLQAWSSVMSSVGSKIARDIQEDMELHY